MFNHVQQKTSGFFETSCHNPPPKFWGHVMPIGETLEPQLFTTFSPRTAELNKLLGCPRKLVNG